MTTSTATILLSIALLTSSLNAKMPTTHEEQQQLTPQAVLTDLIAGNQRYADNKPQAQDVPASIKASTAGQFPKAYILSCVDSRVPVEQVFDQGIGDIFVGRVAANIETLEQIASMEFATKVAGAKLIMVLGHEACGAVKGACDDVKLGHITHLLHQVQPAIANVDGYTPATRNSKNSQFVSDVVEANVIQTISDIRKLSPILNELENQGNLKIVGAVYSLQTGKVKILQ